MPDMHAVAVVLSVYLVGVILPGPNFVAVAHKAASSTTRAALAMVGGIVVVNLFWASCSILGIGMVFATFPWLALAVKVAGAVYLMWFGARLLLAGARPSVRQLGPVPPAEPSDAADGWRAFRAGVATNIANPKAMSFNAAVFAAAAPRHVDPATFVAMLLTVGLVATVWYGFVAIVFARPRVAAAYRRGKRWMDGVCGSIIVGLGVRQLLR
jgi:threonine efflux protein